MRTWVLQAPSQVPQPTLRSGLGDGTPPQGIIFFGGLQHLKFCLYPPKCHTWLESAVKWLQDMLARTCVIDFWKELERIQLRLQFVSSLRAHISQCISHETLPRICQVTDLVFLCNIWAVSMYNSIMFHCEFYDILQNCCRLSPHVSILVSGVVVQPLHKQNFHFKNLNIYRTLIIGV